MREFLDAYMAVSPEVRFGLVSRDIDSNDALAKRKVPVLIVEGERDQLVLPVAADYIASKVKHAKKSCYPNVGCAPPVENSERFNRELAEIAKR
jgi:non-heme chloroperoxidase